MTPDLERLIRLQQLDTTIDEARRETAAHPQRLADAEARLDEATQALDAAKHRLKTSQDTRRDLEKEAAVFQGRLTKFKEQLSAVKTNREYTAMQHEIVMAQDSVRGFEDQILELLVLADELDTAVKATDAALTQERGQVAKERVAREQATSAMSPEIEALLQKRTLVVAEMSREALALFDFVSRSRKGSVVAETRDGHCTACHVRLRPQMYNEVLRGDRLIQCESCSRILFVLPPKAAVPEGKPADATSA